ncbi:peroxidase 44-like [Neltuma alba]|uniref:peroxidase 44-like n=1 Tax=Neltuma alba TaxID=207710 RepID=UPI0010A57281|nr:peroxidase 44-like [Prosopis alba]XP_028761331.1 peroxidase 44-like [Prosopis alba]XP_028761425.1 peroxidase 44-like [Prosopis alba]
MKISSISICFFVLVPFAFGDLQVGFYRSSCPQAESIVRQVVQKRYSSDNSITAALLRMHFHDCFVGGCDASILIDSTGNNKSEQDAPPNKRIRGFNLIHEVKERLEAACPSTVSCADIITLATRDAVALSGGPTYEVPTGRRDGLVSDYNEVMRNLPSPNMTVSEASENFAAKGFTKQEMVTLLGAHTVGVAHCDVFRDRLSNTPGPTMDPALYVELVNKCKPATGKEEPFVSLDQGTQFVFDNQFYEQILLKRGILRLDQLIGLDNSTRGFVSDFAFNRDKFRKSFVDAIIKMASVDVLVGSAGEVRKNCKVFN